MKKEEFFVLENSKIKLVLNPQKGMSFVSCVFKEISKEPLLGTLFHGYYEDISLSADFFSGHAILERPGKHKITDLEEGKVKKGPSSVKHCVKNEAITIEKEILLLRDKICLKKKILLPNRDLAMIHPFNFTLIPTSWRENSLFFATQNGGSEFEIFPLKNHRLNHSESLSPLISAKYGLGATEGKIVIGDGKKGLVFKHSQSASMLLGYLTYRSLEEGNYFLRLHYSAQEIDETFVKSDQKQVIVSQVEIFPTKEKDTFI